jgi:hypothetical protein
MPKKEGAKKSAKTAGGTAGRGARGSGKAAPETLGTEASGLQAVGSGSQRRSAAARSNGAPRAQGAQTAGQSGDAIAMLKADHRRVEEIFAQFVKARRADKAQLIHEACQELIIHTMLEEQLFYPASRRPNTDDLIDEAQVEHDTAKVLIVELIEGDDSDEFREAKFKVLMEAVKLHINEEEAPDGIMDRAQRAGANTPQIAQRMAQLRQRLQQQADAGGLPEPEPVSFQYFGQRDDSRFGGRHGRREDETRRERGGWYGDPRGHAEALHRVWEERDREFRSRAYDRDEDRGRYQRRSHGGWYGDPRGHAEASRRGWDERGGQRSFREREEDDERGRGGWYGDPQGHSEAARRGWDDRDERGRGFRDDDEDDERGPRRRF